VNADLHAALCKYRTCPIARTTPRQKEREEKNSEPVERGLAESQPEQACECPHASLRE
jgi:hypothetical protein